MDISKLETGMILKSYRDLCKVLNWEVTGGNTKISQMKELDRYCAWHKEKNKFIIDEIYNEIQERIDLRVNNGGNHNQGKFKEYKELNISELEWNNIGVYYILKDNDIYIGSTIVGFRDRFQEHYWGNDELMKHTYDMLQDGAIFTILHDMTGINDEVLIRQVENEYMQYFINHTDYNVINKKENAWSLTKKQDKSKTQYKNIKVQKDKYEQAMQCLIDNGFIEPKDTSNNFIDGVINNFNLTNMPF
jgi:hypothetical protein